MKIFFILIITTLSAYADPAAKLTKDGGFILSEQSAKKLNIKFDKLKGTGPWIVPKSSIVQIKFTRGVYRRYENVIVFIVVKGEELKDNLVKVTSQDLQDGDDIAVHGTNYLRLTESDLNSEVVDSCSH